MAKNINEINSINAKLIEAQKHFDEIHAQTFTRRLSILNANGDEVGYINDDGGSLLFSGIDLTIESTPCFSQSFTIPYGETAVRPTEPKVSECYFDTTLGKPIWCKSLSPIVWVDAAGTTV